MSRIVLLLACLPAFCAAQRFTLGPIEFEADADGIVVQYHGHEWKPDLSKLGVGVAGGRPVAWDELNEILYFTAQKVLLGYDLRSEQVKPILEKYEHAYGGRGTVSPLGRYLVFTRFGTCEGCCASSFLVVIDTEAGTQTSHDLPVRITSVRWTGEAVLEYLAEVRVKPDCNVARKTTGRLDVSKME